MSRAVSALVERALLARTPAGDRRTLELALTDDGNALHAEIAPLALAYEAALICGLAPAEVAQLKRLLARLQHAAGTLAGGAAPLADPGLTGL